MGWKATAYLARARLQDDPLLASFLDAGGQVISAEEDHEFEQLVDILSETDVVLDGILGTGSLLPLKPDLALLLQQVGEYRSEFPVVAVDCPSGVDCDSGETAPEALEADLTVCMAAVKVGLLKFPAFNLIGQLAVVGIGLPEDLPKWQAVQNVVVSSADVRDVLPERKRDAHKGTFGTAMIVAGSMNYTGAAYLAGKAAYRAGAGLVRLAVPGPLHTALAGQLPEATWLLLPHSTGVISENAMEVIVKNLDKVTAMLVGPGLGMEDTTAMFIKRLASGNTTQPVRSAIGFVFSPVPKIAESENPALPAMVFDADGLKLLAKIPDWFKMIPAPAVFIPYPGEMAVLTGLSLEEIQADRIAIASRFAREWGHVVVLKGAISVIADPGGQVRVIPVATAALARAGTGDVLAGLITGLRAQGLSALMPLQPEHRSMPRQD